jgi:hypothetical protein
VRLPTSGTRSLSLLRLTAVRLYPLREEGRIAIDRWPAADRMVPTEAGSSPLALRLPIGIIFVAYGAHCDPTLTIEVVEQWFRGLPCFAWPALCVQGLPAGGEAAAALLVAREFMHLRGHASIVVVESRQSLAGLRATA